MAELKRYEEDDKRYSTDEIQYQIQICGDNLGSDTPYWPITEEIYDAIIRKLRAADALKEAAINVSGGLADRLEWAELHKAIAKYEED